MVRTDQAVSALSIVLVYHGSRLPLHLHDGEELGRMPLETEGKETRAMGGRVDLSSRPYGYVRLFVDVPIEELGRYAVLDPPVASLRCG
jgi:hypothetical protein